MSEFNSSSEHLPLCAANPGGAYEVGCPDPLSMLGRPKKKRLNHNELERKRRHHQREILYELRDVIPTLHIVKPSTVLIMQKAKEYIDLLRRTIQEMDVEINDLRRALVAAGYPLPMPAQQQALCGLSACPPPFANNCPSSQQYLPEQVLGVPAQGPLAIDQHAQINLGVLGEVGLVRAQLNSQDLDEITRLQSVLGKGSAEHGSTGIRPISPVSPYQLDQAQGHSSSEFKQQLHNLCIAPGAAGVAITTAAPCGEGL
ncbi:hypothetical protein H4R18_001950 [Coemansia javaensis]|uniref:BHLH domain-containing protein n=1 Tax=Coemansia javaensis TaxID=2761396 RepID=A0A9W8HJW4_9FUNG|nr:hypothetical protein H4R18_001950 [Coemansia javaensis]